MKPLKINSQKAIMFMCLLVLASCSNSVSKQSEYNTKEHEVLKVKIDSINVFAYENADSALLLLTQLTEAVENSTIPELKLKLDKSFGQIYFIKADYKTSNQYFLQVLSETNVGDTLINRSQLLNDIGINFQMMGDYI